MKKLYYFLTTWLKRILLATFVVVFISIFYLEGERYLPDDWRTVIDDIELQPSAFRQAFPSSSKCGREQYDEKTATKPYKGTFDFYPKPEYADSCPLVRMCMDTHSGDVACIEQIYSP